MSLLITDHFDDDYDDHGSNDHCQVYELLEVSLLGVDFFDEINDHDDFDNELNDLMTMILITMTCHRFGRAQ